MPTRHRLLGLRASGGPLFQTSLPLHDGLTVLFGLNGAGKSALLDSLYAALTGQREGVDGRPLPNDADVLLLTEGDSVTARDLLYGQDFWHVLVGDELGDYFGPVPGLLDQFIHQLQGVSTWAYAPDERADAGWNRAVAVAPLPGTAAAEVFQLDQDLKRACRALMIGDAAQAERVISTWPLARTTNFAEPLGLAGAVESGAIFHSHPRSEMMTSQDDCPLDANDGLPVALTYTEEPVTMFREGFGDVRVIAEGGEGEEPGLAALRRSLLACMDGAWLASAGEWRSYPPDASSVLASLPQSQVPGDLQRRLVTNLVGRVSLEGWFDHLTVIVSEIVGRFLLDPPRLKLYSAETSEEAYAGEGLRWATESGIGLERLSRAERRWARLAIELGVLASFRTGEEAPNVAVPNASDLRLQSPTFVLIDEPEAALHRAGEEHMARGLQWLAGQSNVNVVVATHSPELLNEVGASVFRIHSQSRSVVQDGVLRDIPAAVARPLNSVSRDNMAALGLQPSDLLRRQRAFLLVEGQHDALLLQHFIGEALQALRTQVLPLRGARALPYAVDSRFLFDFTDASIVPLLDNLEANRLNSIWDRALLLAATEGIEAAGTMIRSELPATKSAENKFMGEFLSRAIETDVHARVAPFGLSRGDVVEYLPVRAFVPSANSWDELIGRHRASLEAGATRITNWKTFVSKTYATDFSDTRLLEAAQTMTRAPSEFDDLIAYLRLIVTREPAR